MKADSSCLVLRKQTTVSVFDAVVSRRMANPSKNPLHMSSQSPSYEDVGLSNLTPPARRSPAARSPRDVLPSLPPPLPFFPPSLPRSASPCDPALAVPQLPAAANAAASVACAAVRCAVSVAAARLQGNRAGAPPNEMFFHIRTGLTVRETAASKVEQLRRCHGCACMIDRVRVRYHSLG